MLQTVKKHRKLVDQVFPNYSETICKEHEETILSNRDVVTYTV